MQAVLMKQMSVPLVSKPGYFEASRDRPVVSPDPSAAKTKKKASRHILL
jgi:hypothetical protein